MLAREQPPGTGMLPVSSRMRSQTDLAYDFGRLRARTLIEHVDGGMSAVPSAAMAVMPGVVPEMPMPSTSANRLAELGAAGGKGCLPLLRLDIAELAVI